jgi:hypothetical protein
MSVAISAARSMSVSVVIPAQQAVRSSGSNQGEQGPLRIVGVVICFSAVRRCPPANCEIDVGRPGPFSASDFERHAALLVDPLRGGEPRLSPPPLAAR